MARVLWEMADFNFFYIQVVCVGIDVDIDRNRTHGQDRRRGGDKGVWGSDDLISWFDTQRTETLTLVPGFHSVRTHRIGSVGTQQMLFQTGAQIRR